MTLMAVTDRLPRHQLGLFFILSLTVKWVCSISPVSSSVIQFPGSATAVSVTDFGAIGDGVHYETIHIQLAIDSCFAAASSSDVGRCSVIFPPGRYLTATIFLKSGVVLEVQAGAIILGGTELGDYPAESNRWYVIMAEDAADVGIIGEGEINGQGLKFVQKFDERKNVMVSWNGTGACLGDECRPRLVGFLRCRNVHVSNVNLVQPAYWCLHIVKCQNTTIHGVSIIGDFNSPNNDGIDIEDSNNTLITKCHIDTGDDAICPKTYSAPLHNLTATDCWIKTKSSAIKLGSASWFNFENLVFDNITIAESHRGLAVQIRDGGKHHQVL